MDGPSMIRTVPLLLAAVSLSFAACGGSSGGGGGTPEARNPTDLAALSFVGVTLSPEFRPDIRSYTGTVDNSVGDLDEGGCHPKLAALPRRAHQLRLLDIEQSPLLQ